MNELAESVDDDDDDAGSVWLAGLRICIRGRGRDRVKSRRDNVSRRL